MSQEPIVKWLISEASLHASARTLHKDPEHIREICRQHGIRIMPEGAAAPATGVLIAFQARPGSRPPRPGASRDFQCSQCHSPVWIAPKSIPYTNLRILCTKCLPDALPRPPA